MYSLRFPSELRQFAEYNFSMLYNWQTTNLFPLYQSIGPREEYNNQGGMVYYNKEGFLPIQNAIATAFIKVQSAAVLPPIWLQVRLDFASPQRSILKALVNELIQFLNVIFRDFPTHPIHLTFF